MTSPTGAEARSLIKALDEKERHYLTEFGECAIAEVKLELVCEDNRLSEAVDRTPPL